MKGKSTAAFGLALRAWNQGWPIVVYQFVKSAKWKTGEESALRALDDVHAETGQGAPVTWHKMGEGWSWIRKPGTEDDHAADAREGWAQVKRDLAAEAYRFYVLDEFTYPMKWGWVDVDDVVADAREPPGRSARRDHRPVRRPAAGRGGRPGRRDDQGQAPDGRRPEGPGRHRVVTLPRLVVAAPASGQGKTTVATGLMAALRARGLAVSGHKAGPDYIDPGYHALATGRPGRNLDPVLCGEDLIAPLFAHGAAGADIAVVEGVMGLFDGRGTTSFGSTAHVARLLGAPVLLVVDAAAQGRSVAALVAGFAGYDPRLRLGGVILNRVGSARHEEILRAALGDLGVPVLGALRRDDGVTVPSRHLGLVPVAEREGPARHALDRLGAVVGAAVDLDAVLRLAASAGPLPAAAWSPDAALASWAPQTTLTQTAAGRWWRWRAGPRSASATPERPNCWPRPGPRSSGWTRCATRPCRPGPRRWCSAAGSPRCTWPTWPPTSGSARTWPGWPGPGARSSPSAPACCTWPANWTASRCAGCWTPPPG